MTTIAWDGKTVAADTQLSYGYTLAPGKHIKYYEIGDGTFLLGSGLVSEIADWAEYMKERAQGERPKVPRLKESTLWVLTGRGKNKRVEEVLRGDRYVHVMPINAPWAIGSGGEFALGAMGAGATAEEAVKIASKFDPFTNNKVTVLE